MKYAEIINEVRYEDTFPKAFVEFREKWLAEPRENWEGLYVNFSNYGSDVLQKAAYTDPDHHDPVGLYGYPLDYVMDHPSDIWYGQQATSMRLLRSEAKNVFNLQTPLSQEQALELLSKTIIRLPAYYWDNYPNKERDFLELALKRFGFKGSNKYTRSVFAVVQYKLQYNQKAVALTGVEQTRHLLDMGFDAVEDRAKDEYEAVINSREPEQIIFLKRDAFRVIETVALRDRMGTTGLVYFKSTFDKLAGLIAHKTGDRLNSNTSAFVGLYTFFYTKAGRKIALRADFPNFEGGKSSFKPHRGAGTDTKEAVMIKFETEFGTFEHTFPSDATFEEISDKVAEWFSKVSQTAPAADYAPASLYKDRPEIAVAVESWQTLADHYGVQWPQNITEKGATMIAQCTSDLDRVLCRPFARSWVKPKRLTMKDVRPVIEAFWAKQRNARLQPAMLMIMTKLFKDKNVPTEHLSSISGAAKAA